ncbi:hypothetical protein [Sporosarcina sp. P16b]|nr:hypothetical protein [Sporosarcina sp. P16b]
MNVEAIMKVSRTGTFLNDIGLIQRVDSSGNELYGLVERVKE